QGFLFADQAATRDQAAAVIWRVWQQRTQEKVTPPAEEESPASPAEESTSAEGVTVLGPTRLKVAFSQDLDPGSLQAGPEGNFTLVLAGTAFSPGIVTGASLVSAREVVLEVPTLEGGKEYTLSAYDLRAADGQKLSSTPLSFTFLVPADNEAPRLLSANSTGPAGLELTFSEDLDETQAADLSLYRLRGNGASPQTALVTGRTVALIFAAPLTVGETYTVEVDGVKDLWGNRAATLTSSFVVRTDNYPPRLLAARAVSDTAVEAYFNENLAAIGNFTLKRNGRTLEIVRAEQVAPGRVRLTAYLSAEGTYTLETQGALDSAGNKAEAARVYFT
ncbi:MAG: Ig-like domain-containing protein, partial [Desulfofundulus sp.]